MPDIQILRFNKFKRTPQGQLIGPAETQFVSASTLRKSSSIGIPLMRGDLTMPLNDDGTFSPGTWETNPNTGVERFNESPMQVYDIDKAIQDTTRGVLTVKGTNYLVPNYGTALSSLVNTRKLGDVASQITGEIQFVLGYLAQVNASDSPTEIVAEIVNLTGTEDNQTINLELTVRTAEGSQGSILLT